MHVVAHVRSCVVFLLSHDLTQVHRKGDLGDEVDGIQWERRRRLHRVPEAVERCRCAHDVHSCFVSATHLRDVDFTGAPGVPDLRSAADPT